MNTLSLPASPIQVMADHWARKGVAEPEWKADPLGTPMRLLSQVEFATIHVRFRQGTDLCPPTHGTVTTAALRIALWEVMGKRFSGRRLASELQHFFFNRGPVPREPWSGWDLLAAIDRTADAHGVEVWLQAEPLDPDWTRFRTMRLSQRLVEVKMRDHGEPQ